jgi:hypothetical protein
MTTAVNGSQADDAQAKKTKLHKIEGVPDEGVQGGRGREGMRSRKTRGLWLKAAEPAF